MTSGRRDPWHIWTSYTGIKNSGSAKTESFKWMTLSFGLAKMASIWIQVLLHNVEN